MYGKIKDHLQQELKSIKEAGLYKNERIITSAQDAEIAVSSGEQVLNFCANNYLGLSNHPALIQAAKDALDSHGYGMSSVRFICGTQDLHKELEKQIADFFGTEDTIFTDCRGKDLERAVIHSQCQVRPAPARCHRNITWVSLQSAY